MVNEDEIERIVAEAQREALLESSHGGSSSSPGVGVGGTPARAARSKRLSAAAALSAAQAAESAKAKAARRRGSSKGSSTATSSRRSLGGAGGQTRMQRTLSQQQQESDAISIGDTADEQSDSEGEEEEEDDKEHDADFAQRAKAGVNRAKNKVLNGSHAVAAALPAPPAVSVQVPVPSGIQEEFKENVFLFVPNLIGYSRIILAAFSLYFMQWHPKNCTVLYGISCLLDAFDGMAARALGQSTRFGAVLDMVTDRCTTSCLLCFLTAAYPRATLLFQGLITLDFSSHYIHMYSTLVTGGKSHKTVSKEVSKWLWYYYNDSRTLFVFCAGNEIFFVCLYLMAFYTRPLGIDPAWVLAPLGRANVASIQARAVLDPFSNEAALLRLIKGLTWPQLLGALTFPICAVKQLINAIQFWKAAKALAELDAADRKKLQAQSPKKLR